MVAITFMHHTDIMGSGIDTVFHQLMIRAHKWFDKVYYLTVKTDYANSSNHILIKPFLDIDNRMIRNLFFLWPPSLISALKIIEKSDVVFCSSFPMALLFLQARRPLKCFIGWGRAPPAPYLGLHEKIYMTVSWLIEKEALRYADIRLSPSRFVQQMYERDGIQTTFMYLDGIDFKTYDYKKFNDKKKLKKQFTGSEDKHIVSFVGRIVPHKNIETLIIAMKKVIKENSNTILLIAGPKDVPYYYKYLKSLIKYLRLEKFIRFLGKLNWYELASLYAASDLYVSPSLWEGFFRAEPYAMKVPMVLFDVASASETVIDGVTGKLVKEISSDALADAILDLLNDEERRKQMGEAGYKWAYENLNFDRIAERLFNLLLESL
jgi:glycosyltransferase involved in cell wall biosynthesis